MIYDIAVIGAGHAGFEAALAAARLGMKTAVFALSLDSVGNMPCNPSIGGVAKGQIVREIDALGGEMAKAADACCIQFRMLNRGKGPAVRSPRAQADRAAYTAYVKRALENHPGILLRQAEISDIRPDGAGETVLTDTDGIEYRARAVVAAAGTYLNARVVTGESARGGGPDGLRAATGLTSALERLGAPARRFKTGTPPRVKRSSVDFSAMELQAGDCDATFFSFETPGTPVSRENCYLTWTNARTHDILRANLRRSPLYNGSITGVGARYCPSIEDKVTRFAGKDRHPVFVEPMGADSGELYLQGFSSSMPPDVQTDAMRTIAGLEHAEITRMAYAIEYDCIDPLCLTPALMLRDAPGIFAAGQICGSSGYEEAAGQGLVAGINAARFVRGEPPFILTRQSSYIGTLIDDLVTRGTDEPYRMMTSRSEYRLLLRHDNADRRLIPIGRAIGLASRERLEELERREILISGEKERLERVSAPPSDGLSAMLTGLGETPPATGVRLADLLRRPAVTYEALAPFDPGRPELPGAVTGQVEIEIKYAGYIKRQNALLSAMSRMERRPLPKDADYASIAGLSAEAAQKLSKQRPESLGQAGRIPGVSPADITVLMLYCERMGGNV
ncbi:MAG: tRNA uridine-5-carboxymethylaminomethyl(34) synthesis enzyme MnmG [Oscillospiraceae bacterium]|nr:tRNA uridine-5-carboxymethylaminomethyl(34) synthesis enzyme MnmG [Oscillospiraceae bacterium]